MHGSPNAAWPTGWHKLIYPFKDEKVADLIDKNQAIVVSEIVAGILKHIQLLETAFIEATSTTPSSVASQ